MPDPAVAYSIVIPCYNEESAIERTVEEILERALDPAPFQIVVVDDGSTDRTPEVLGALAERDPKLRVIRHQRNLGYGASLKTGLRAVHTELVAITDADGTYPNERIPELVRACESQDMVVGARTAEDAAHSRLRLIPKFFLRRWMSWIARQDIPDINSGMRVFRRSVAERYIGILPDGFSFTVTITLAMLTNFRPTVFVPVTYRERIGRSKLRPIRDTVQFVALILRTGTYFAPIRVFGPIAGLLALLLLASLAYDIWIGNITEKTVILFMAMLNAGMFALLADMIDKRSIR